MLRLYRKRPGHNPPINIAGTGSLVAVIRSCKAAVTGWCRQNGHHFAWQPRFHAQILRGDRTLAAARAYIRDNPGQWALDRDNPAEGDAADAVET